MVMGRIEEIDPDWIKIDGRSRDRLGRHYGLALAVIDVLRFSFEDTRFVPLEENPDAAEQVKKIFDGFLFIQLDWCECVIGILKLPDELSA